MKHTALLFFIALAFLALTVPENHSEAEDAYYYARMVESGSGAELIHGHHLLYLPVGKALLGMLRTAGYGGRALPVLIAWSVIAGAASVALMASLLRRSGVWGAAGLLCSYGFWRYCGTAEIYVPMLALALGALVCAARADGRPKFAMGSLLLSAGALALHVASLPAVVLGIPVLYIARGERRHAVWHVLGVALLAGGGYAAAWGSGMGIFHDADTLRSGLASPRAWLGGLAAFGHTLLSGNFVFSWPAAAERIQSLLPYHMLQEEVFMGRMAPAVSRVGAPITALAAFVLLARWGWTLWKGRRWNLVAEAAPGRAPRSPLVYAAAVWLAGSCGIALLFEPANPEMWIPALPAFWLLAGLRSAHPRAVAGCGLRAAVLGLLIHNTIGGMALVWSAEGDYAARHGGVWLATHAGARDCIVEADSHSAITWLEYHTQARVLDARFVDEQTWERLLHAEFPGRVWISGRVFDPPQAFLRRDREAVARWRKLADLLRPAAILVHEDSRCRIYEWKPNSHTPAATP
ncbi:MAG: hypothetical protein KBA51_05000 [Kiritimatiellae bacterium]|nr:hypothetical protein [Kiritimatiellia bacterium]